MPAPTRFAHAPRTSQDPGAPGQPLARGRNAVGRLWITVRNSMITRREGDHEGVRGYWAEEM